MVPFKLKEALQCGQEHRRHQERPAEDLLPAAAEEEQTTLTYDGALLHCQHRVYSLLLHHHQSHCCHYTWTRCKPNPINHRPTNESPSWFLGLRGADYGPSPLSHLHGSVALSTPLPLTTTPALSALSCKSSPELTSVQGLILREKQHSPLLP